MEGCAIIIYLPLWDVKMDTMPRQLNSTAASLLGFLHEGPMTGWDLVAIAQRRIGDFWSLTQSQVYRELAAMAEADLVRAGERGPRDRQPYELTDAGRAAFREWLNREPGAETIRFPLLLMLVFGRHLEPGRAQRSSRATAPCTRKGWPVTRRNGPRRVMPRATRSPSPRSTSGSPTSAPSSPGSTGCPQRSPDETGLRRSFVPGRGTSEEPADGLDRWFESSAR